MASIMHDEWPSTSSYGSMPNGHGPSNVFAGYGPTGLMSNGRMLSSTGINHTDPSAYWHARANGVGVRPMGMRPPPPSIPYSDWRDDGRLSRHHAHRGNASNLGNYWPGQYSTVPGPIFFSPQTVGWPPYGFPQPPPFPPPPGPPPVIGDPGANWAPHPPPAPPTQPQVHMQGHARHARGTSEKDRLSRTSTSNSGVMNPGPSDQGDCWNNAVVAWEQRTLIHNKIGLIVNNRYKIIQNIDSGSYGTIFVAEDLEDNNNRVAVKFDAASKDDHLKYEYEVYKSALYDDGVAKIEGFPQVYWFGNQYGHNVLVMELLGPPVASLFNFCERKFGLQTIVTLGEQMIHRIRHLHQRGFIHRDCKPENFLVGLGENESICYLIDFGLARRYRYREGRLLKHIPFRKGRTFVGTAKYASLNSHKNAELGRRDDIESLGYILIELINGSLPWKKLKVRNAYSTKHQMYTKIKNMKEQANWSDVCPAMAGWMEYVRKLHFLDEPDYDLLLDIIRRTPEICNTTTLVSLSESLLNLSFDDPRCLQCRQQSRKIYMEKLEKPDSDNQNDDVKNEECGGRERKLSKSSSLSVVNSVDPNAHSSALKNGKRLSESASIQDIHLIDPHPVQPAQHSPIEDDTASTSSTCRKCRQRRQRYFDERAAATGVKYSWQIWRETTPELKFHYENRFSWTLPKRQQFASTQHSDQPNREAFPTVHCPLPMNGDMVNGTLGRCYHHHIARPSSLSMASSGSRSVLLNGHAASSSSVSTTAAASTGSAR